LTKIGELGKKQYLATEARCEGIQVTRRNIPEDGIRHSHCRHFVGFLERIIAPTKLFLGLNKQQVVIAYNGAEA
jgi:hypothetical protein